MTYEAAKEKLYWYIEHADQSKVMALCTLLHDEIDRDATYDENTIRELEKRRDDALAGKIKTYELGEFKAHISDFRKKHGI